jgi:hypothetical protein
MADEDVQVQFGAAIDGAIAGIKQVSASIEEMAAPIAALQEAFSGLGEVIVATFAVEKIASFVEAFADLGTQTQRTATLLGISTQEVSGFDLMARSTGGSVEGFTTSMERLSMQLNRSQSAASPARAALAALGITAKELQSLPLEGKIELLADKFSHLADSTEKDAIAMALGGRTFAQMIPLFNQGAAAVEEFLGMSQRAGSSMSGPQLEAAKRLHEGILELGAAYQGVKNTIATALEPAFSGLIQITTQLLESFNNAAKGPDTMGVALRALVTIAQSITTALAIVVATLETLWSVEKIILDSIPTVARVVSDLLSRNFGDLLVAGRAWLGTSHAIVKQAADDMEKTTNDLVSNLKKIWATGDAAEAEHFNHGNEPKKQAPGLNIGGAGDAQRAMQEQLQAQIRGFDESYAMTKEHLETEVKLHQISQAEETKELEAALSQRLALTLDALSHELAIYPKGSAEYAKVQAEMTAVAQKAAAERQKIEDKEAEETQKKWDDVGKQITSAISSQNKALLDGSETFAQAFKNIFADMVLKVLAELEKILIEDYIIKGVQIALFGPAGALPTFDVGTNAVTQSGLAMVHAGETIVPAEGNGPYTGGAGAGGGSGANIAFNVSAIDAGSVQSFFSKFGRQIANQLAPHLNQPSLAQ